jgi:hypothetical protein
MIERSHYTRETKYKKYYQIVIIYRQIVNINQPEHYQFYCMHEGIEPAPYTFITLLHGEVLIHHIKTPPLFSLFKK